MLSRSITISAGRGCFTRCEGCFNFFGEGNAPLDTSLILRFATFLRKNGIEKITLSGEDPLSRADIVSLSHSLKKMGFRIHLDTVGTPFLGSTQTQFYGVHDSPFVSMANLKSSVDLLGIPIDGSTNEIASLFRAGRPRLIEEQEAILSMADELDFPVCIDTVVHRGNILNLESIFLSINAHSSVKRWQLFQFMPIGPLGFRNRSRFEITNEEFEKAIARVSRVHSNQNSSIIFDPKSSQKRKNNYLFVDPDGKAWIPEIAEKIVQRSNETRTILGNIQNEDHFPLILNAIRGGRD